MNDLVLDLHETLTGSAHWRTEKAQDYPADAARNLDAAKRLDRLAEDLVDPATEAGKRLSGVVLDTTTKISAVNEYIGKIGFHNFPADAAEFISDIRDLVCEAA